MKVHKMTTMTLCVCSTTPCRLYSCNNNKNHQIANEKREIKKSEARLHGFDAKDIARNVDGKIIHRNNKAIS